jgi:hypothetical protein
MEQVIKDKAKNLVDKMADKEWDNNTFGLKVLTWDMFDSPGSDGSGFRFMDRELVVLLDEICNRNDMKINVVLGYTSKTYADNHRLPSNSPHRVGKGVRIRCVGHKKRFNLIQQLIMFGIARIAVSRDVVYFDIDDLKEYGFYLW